MTEEQETYHIEKDPETGRIVSLEQTSERAAEIGALGGRAAAKRRAKDAQELYNALVAVLPALDDVERQAARDMLLLHLCRTAVSEKGQSSLTSIQALGQLVGQAFASKPGPSMIAPGASDVCPLCRRVDATTLSLTPAARATLRKLLAGAAWQVKAKLEGWHEPNWRPE